MIPVMIAGALVGAGLFGLVLLFDQRPAPGPAALSRLDLDRARARRNRGLSGDVRHATESMSLRRLGAGLRGWLDKRGIDLPNSVTTDLAMVGRSVENHIAITVIAALVGLLAPLLLGAVLFVIGIPVGSVPLVFAVAIAIVAAALPTLQVRSRAAKLRRDMRHVISSYLDLVAMNLSGGRGVPEALDAAAAVSTTAGMGLIREALGNARLQGVTPWAALGSLGEQLGIAELKDLSAALTLVAEDGAKVKESLYARADSMRQRELAEMEGRAQSRSQSMLVAQLLLCFGFLMFLLFPAVARILGT